MKYNNLEKYFETYLEKFTPFRDKQLYIELIKFFKETYFKDSYVNIPFVLKQLFENQTIPTNIYNLLLLSLGFPKSVINNAILPQKKILLEVFGDFNRYKGSRYLINTFLTAYHQRTNAYELYIDYRNGDWCFVPWNIHHDDQIDLITTPLDYDEINALARHFLISKQQLTAQKNNERIVLPIKSNILYLQSEENLYISYIENIIFMATLQKFQHTPFVYYALDQTLVTTLLGIIQMWLYLLLRSNHSSFPAIAAATQIIITSGSSFPYSIDPGPYNVKTTLQAAYDNITTIRERDAFFKTFIRNTLFDPTKFETIAYSSPEITITSLRTKFQSPLSPVGSLFVDYIDTRLDNAVNFQQEANLIFEEIRNSVLYWNTSQGDVLLDEYIDYILRFLDTTHPCQMYQKDSFVYNFLEFVKPYHTDLIRHRSNIIQIKDKFEALLLDDSFKTEASSVFYKPYIITDEYNIFITSCLSDDFVILDNFERVIINMPYEESYIITDSFSFIGSSSDFVSALVLSDDYESFMTSCLSDDFVILDNFERVIINMPYEESYKITDSESIIVEREMISAVVLSDDFILSRNYNANFTFTATTTVQTDVVGCDCFNIDDFIFAPGDETNDAKQIVNKNDVTFVLTLQDAYAGTTGIFSEAFKRY